jgi:hypothetical protein
VLLPVSATKTAPSAPVAPVAPSAPVAAVQPSAQEVRQWARERGYELPSFGRIPKHIRAHYDDAHTIAGAPAVDEQAAVDETDALAAAREIRESVGPIRHEDGTLNASAIAQESTLRAQAGIKGWIAELDAPKDTPTPNESDVAAAAELLVESINQQSVAHWVEEFVDPRDYPAPAVAQPARPEWGYVALQEDLQHATAATTTALEERDRARDLAARLFDELHRVETTAAEHRERSAAALADYLRDLGTAEQAIHDAQQALAAAAEGRRIAESALQLALRKWGELRAENNTLRAYPSLIGGLLR